MSEEGFVDGTNIFRGTKHGYRLAVTRDWYRPTQTHCIDRWRQKLIRIRDRFEELSLCGPPLRATLVQDAIPRMGFDNGCALEPFGPRREALFQSFGGVRREIADIVNEEGNTVFGEFSFLDAYGKPIENSAGESFGISLGYFRTISLTGDERDFTAEVHDAWREVIRIAALASPLALHSPRTVRPAIWRNFRQGFRLEDQHEPKFWLEALFESGWHPDAPSEVSIKRACIGPSTSFDLYGDGCFPRMERLSDLPGEFTKNLHQYNGVPLSWKASVGDVAGASARCIDWLLNLEAGTQVIETAPQARNVGAADRQAPRVFISYSHADARHRDRLDKHLAALRRERKIAAWHDAEISAGGTLDSEIKAEIDQATVYVFLVSSSLLASEYVMEIELPVARHRFDEGSATIIPVILSDCDWESTFGDVKALPEDGRPVTSFRNHDKAWRQVAKALRNICD